MKQTKKIEYHLKDEFARNIKGVPIQKVGEEINSLINKCGGKLKPIDVVDDAKSKDSVLHNYFEWDNTIAGKKYRLQQARDLIANIVEVVVIEGVQSKQRSFYSISDKKTKEKAYVTLKQVVSNDNYRKETLTKIISHLENTTQLMRMFQDYTK